MKEKEEAEDNELEMRAAELTDQIKAVKQYIKELENKK